MCGCDSEVVGEPDALRLHMELSSDIRHRYGCSKRGRVARPTPAKTGRAQARIGEGLAAWRKLQGLTARQVSERAGISPALSRLENGKTPVSLETFLNVARVLGQLERVIDAVDPYETDIGRLRADEELPKRVRHG